MTDIHQWRRMIQPSRARTPAVDTDDSDGFLSPTTPRKGLSTKLSSYFTQHAASTGLSKANIQLHDDMLGPGLPSWSDDNAPPCPQAQCLIDSIMCRLLAEPYKSLDSRFNGTLLEIFEAFRNLSDDKKQLQAGIQHEIERRCNVERAMHQSAQQWEREKKEYKAEVKRLELILAKGERGVAEVTLARQDSMLRYGKRTPKNINSDKTLETVFEFLERTKHHEDKIWSSQRGEDSTLASVALS